MSQILMSGRTVEQKVLLTELTTHEVGIEGSYWVTYTCRLIGDRLMMSLRLIRDRRPERKVYIDLNDSGRILDPIYAWYVMELLSRREAITDQTVLQTRLVGSLLSPLPMDTQFVAEALGIPPSDVGSTFERLDEALRFFYAVGRARYGIPHYQPLADRLLYQLWLVYPKAFDEWVAPFSEFFLPTPSQRDEIMEPYDPIITEYAREVHLREHELRGAFWTVYRQYRRLTAIQPFDMQFNTIDLTTGLLACALTSITGRSEFELVPELTDWVLRYYISSPESLGVTLQSFDTYHAPVMAFLTIFRNRKIHDEEWPMI